MNSSTVRELTPADEQAAAAILVLAFAADPVTRWTWPHPHAYLAAMPRLARAFGGNAFACAGAHCVGDYAGAALWLPPGVEPDQESLAELMQSTLSPSQLEGALALFQQMASYHPREPHWYLPLIGVDPAQQGKGLGDALMSYALERCDRDNALAYLESTNPRNVPLYQRHGFEPLGSIQAGASPPWFQCCASRIADECKGYDQGGTCAFASTSVRSPWMPSFWIRRRQGRSRSHCRSTARH